MRATRRWTLLRALALAFLGCAGLAEGARAQIAYHACPDSEDFACGHVQVPLARDGAVPGTISLAIRRHRAPVGEAGSAIVALAGGPGQAALPFAEAFVELLGSVTATRDVIAFDQRGTGQSRPLSCHAFERSAGFRSLGALVSACAQQLGAQRSFFTTQESVEDIEAIRQAGGYQKLVLYGTSYGTKVAELYAEEHPEHLEALVLDSVVTPSGPDTLGRSTFAAVDRVLDALCVQRACMRVTHDPGADLARLLARARRAPLHSSALDGHGRRHRVSIGQGALFNVLLQGDFSPLLRGELVTDVRAAVNGDRRPLARLVVAAAAAAASEQEDFDTPLYYATTCEEQAFPWRRASPPRTRLAEATAAARALPADTFAPFAPTTAIAVSDIPACAGWPYTGALAAAPSAPLPPVPTLILSGAEDLRTPTSDARAFASQIPGAQLLVVPFTGHAVLGDEPTNCARDAVAALFAGHPPVPCSHTRPAGVLPPPLPPPDLGAVAPRHGVPGRPGRTLHAVALTLVDLARQLSLALGAEEDASGALSVGGLRSGFARFAEAKLRLRDYSFVPSVTITGTLSPGVAHLHIAGRAAAAGELHLAAHGTLVGTLEGRAVSLPATSIGSAAIVRPDEQASPSPGAGLAGRARRCAPGCDQRLHRLLGDVIAPLLRTLR